jgi:hypothetical protein
MELLLFHVEPIRLSHLRLECSGDVKRMSSGKKACNIVSANRGLQNDAEHVSSVSEAVELFITQEMLEESCTKSKMYSKAVAVVQVTNAKKIGWKLMHKELHTFIGAVIAAGRNFGEYYIFRRNAFSSSVVSK